MNGMEWILGVAGGLSVVALAACAGALYAQGKDIACNKADVGRHEAAIGTIRTELQDIREKVCVIHAWVRDQKEKDRAERTAGD